jgi:hypothetical protein
MKKLLAFVLFLTVACKADAVDLSFQLGPAQFTLPFQQVDAVYLYDFTLDDHLLGGETPFANIWDASFTFGAYSDVDGIGSPFLGVHFLSSDRFFAQRFTFGGWVSWDAKLNDARAGLKASVNLFGGS